MSLFTISGFSQKPTLLGSYRHEIVTLFKPYKPTVTKESWAKNPVVTFTNDDCENFYIFDENEKCVLFIKKPLTEKARKALIEDADLKGYHMGYDDNIWYVDWGYYKIEMVYSGSVCAFEYSKRK